MLPLRLAILGFGFMGIMVLWGIYNAYVPIFLQAGRPDFAEGAGVQGFGFETATASAIMTLDNVAALFILPWIGALSDRIRTRWGRRKPFIAAGAPLAAAGFALVPLMLGGPLIAFMGAIFLTLMAMDLFRTPTIALMADITPSPQRSMANGIINLMGGVGLILAYMVGGPLFSVSVAAPFLFGAVMMLFGCGVVLAVIREPAPEAAAPGDEEPRLIASLRDVLRDRDRSALRLLAAILFWYLSVSAIEVFFTSFAVNELGVDSGQATALLGWFPVSILLCSVPGGLLGVHFGRRRIVLLGLIGFTLVMLAGDRATTVAEARVILALAGVCWSLILVNSLPMVMDCAPPGRVGTYTGLYYLSTQSSSIIGPILAGWIIGLCGNDYRVMFHYGATVLVIAIALMSGVRRGEART